MVDTAPSKKGVFSAATCTVEINLPQKYSAGMNYIHVDSAAAQMTAPSTE